MRHLLLLLLALSCRPEGSTDKDPVPDTAEPVDEDADRDGYTLEDGDCDDGDATVHPAATEACDGRDNDCVVECEQDRTTAVGHNPGFSGSVPACGGSGTWYDCHYTDPARFSGTTTNMSSCLDSGPSYAVGYAADNHPGHTESIGCR